MLLCFNCFSLEFACLALQEMPIAVETDKAKSQHYEVPTSFYKLVLGRNLKYRCAWLAYGCNLMISSSTLLLFPVFCYSRKGEKLLELNFIIHFCSCCYFRNGCTLDDAEIAMLELYCERAQLKDGQTVLDVGCGWGSLTLYIAEKYRNCKVTGICNSNTQKAYIGEQCK